MSQRSVDCEKIIDDHHCNHLKFVYNYNELFTMYSDLKNICQDFQTDIENNENLSNDGKNR